jgi:hypothetical protein
MTNDTVAWEQPASRAISVIVTRREFDPFSFPERAGFANVRLEGGGMTLKGWMPKKLIHNQLILASRRYLSPKFGQSLTEKYK